MRQLYHFAFFDEASKREIRRAVLKGIAIPGHQIPFASREMPIGRDGEQVVCRLPCLLLGRMMSLR